MPKVYVHPRAARAFKRAAWAAAPKEYIAAAFGTASRNGDAEIVAFGSLPHGATVAECEVDAVDLTECRRKVVGSGLYFLGTVHSHPDCIDASPSEVDWLSTEAMDDLLTGICALRKKGKRRYSRFRFYRAHSPYVEVKNKKELS